MAMGCLSLEFLSSLDSESVVITYRWPSRSGHCAAAIATLAVLSFIFITTEYSNTVASASSPQSLPTTELRTSHPIPALIPASSLLRQECAVAATRLGFAVPCPGLVPSLSGRAMSCPTPVGAATSTPCVGREGSTGYLIFYLEFSGFDVPKGYSGVDGKPVGQVRLEAHQLADDPLNQPCIGGERIGTARVAAWTTTEFVCPNDSLQAQREAQHGEGDYVGHLALVWSAAGITYIASAHGHTTANLTLLKKFVNSIVLIMPSNRPG
jgi:hypothetical protein